MIADRPFRDSGAQRFEGAAAGVLARIEAAVVALPQDRAGLRLTGIGGLAHDLSATGAIGGVAATVLGAGCRPVRALLFDKTADTNWSLAWHQDRTICVRERIAVPGFGPWTCKQGVLHVAPPMSVLAGMVTLRVHVDAVDADNAPLLVAPGSHGRGRIATNAVAGVVAACGTLACLADAGDVWMYATPILHASEAARVPRRRRVLQLDYAADDLPGGLEWLGV